MRRLLILTLLLALLAGCGAPAVPEPPPPPPPEPVEPETPPPAPVQAPYEIKDPTEEREGYVPWTGVVEHLFFHPVIAYPELAFDGDSQENGLDDYMVTVDEYKKILQSVYEKGYVLVDVGSVWRETEGKMASRRWPGPPSTSRRGRSPWSSALTTRTTIPTCWRTA